MTIDEAIRHCEEVAEQNEFETRIYDELNRQGDEEYRNNHCQCAADHRQLASWLRELKKAKKFIRKIENKLYLGTSFYPTSFLKENEKLFDELTKGVEYLDD